MLELVTISILDIGIIGFIVSFFLKWKNGRDNSNSSYTRDDDTSVEIKASDNENKKYDEAGYDADGYDSNGIDRNGYDRFGYYRFGFKRYLKERNRNKKK